MGRPKPPRPNKRRRRKRTREHVYRLRNRDLGIDGVSVKDEFGRVLRRSVKLPAEAMAFFQSIHQAYEAKFGSSPPAGMTIEEAAEKVGIKLPSNEEYLAEMAATMEAVGIAPEIIYAFKKTGGLLVTDTNQHMIDDRDLEAWDRAIQEYLESHP